MVDVFDITLVVQIAPEDQTDSTFGNRQPSLDLQGVVEIHVGRIEEKEFENVEERSFVLRERDQAIDDLLGKLRIRHLVDLHFDLGKP